MAQQSLGLSSAEAASLLRGCLANVYSMRGKAARDNWLWISVIVRLTTLILLLQILGSLIFSLPIISLMVIETCLIIWFKCIALSEVGLRARHLSEKISTSMNYTSGAEPPSDAIRLVHCYRDGKLVVLPEILLVVGDVVLLDQDQQQSEIGEFCTLFDSEKSINNDFESSDLKFPTLSPPSRYKIKICPLSVQLDCLSLGLSLNLRNGFLGGVSSHSLTIVFHLLTLISNYLIGKPSMARSSAICIAIIHSPLWFIFMLAYCNARLLVLFEMHARDACESKTSVFVEADESEIDEFDEAAPPPTRHVNIYFSQIFLKFLSNMIPSTKFRAYNLFWSFDYADALGTVSVMSFLDREGPIAVPFPLPTEIILPEKKDSDDGALSLTIVELITNVADPLTTRMRLPDGGTDRLRLFKRSIKALSLGMTFLTQNPDINACINRPNEWHLRIPWYNQMGSQFNKKHCPAISTCLCHFGRYLGISTNTINRYLPFCVTSSIDPCIIEHEKSMAMSNALKKFNSCLKSPRILVSEVDPTGSVTFGIGSLSEVANIIGYYWDGNTSKIVKITKGIKKRLFDIGNRSLSSDIQCLGIFLDPQSSNVHDIKDSVPSMASETGNNNGSGHDFEKHSENGSPHSFEKEEKILTNNRIPITRLKRGSIFLGAVCCEYLPKQHMQELIDDLENCGIRWVYFSPLDEVATKAFGDRCGLETEWNSCIVLGERSSFKNGPPTGTEVDTKAKLPRGISNVRPHLQIVDDIPLHISLFSNCDSRSTSEMMEVYEEWGEVVVAVRSALNWTTIQTSLHSRLSISMTSRDSTDLNLLNFTDYKFLDSFNNPRIKRALVEKVSVPLFHTYALFIALTFSFSELLSYFLSWFPEFKHRFLYHNGFVDTSTSDCIENEKFASDGSNQSNFPMFFPENNSGNPDKVQCSLTLATAIGCIGSPMAGLPFDSNPYLLTELIREGRRLEGGRRNGLRCMWSYFILSIFIFIDTKISVGEIYVTCIFVSLLSMTCVMNGPVESGMMRMMPFSKPLHTGMTPVFLDTIPVIIHELSMYLLRILLSIFSWYSASLLCGIELRTLRSLFTLGFCATMMHTTHSVLIFGPIQNPLWSVVATLFFVTSFRGTLWNIGFISTLIYTLLTLGITNEGVKSFWWRPEVDRMQRRARLHFNTKLGMHSPI